MADASAQQERLRSPAEPRFREPALPVTGVTSAQGQAPAVEEYRVEPEPDPIDKLVDLLAQPPMPPDLCPVVWLRGAGDHRYADTALTRLVFQRCLEPEYAQAGAQPHQPIMPPRDHMIVDVETQTGVVALVNMLFAIDERATARSMEIPQLAVWLSMYREADGLRAACENAWQRIEGLRQQAAQRRAAQQAQARPVASAPAYGAPAAHGAHPSYMAPQQPAYQQPAPAAAGSGQAYYGHPQGVPSGTGHYSR